MTEARFPDVRLSVVVPAYNEEVNLLENLPRMVAHLEKQVGVFELILIDDCSTDATGEILERFARGRPAVVVHNEVNLKQGGSLRVGFELASLDWVTHNAADYPFSYNDLGALLVHAASADVLVAERRTYEGASVTRRVMSAVNRWAIRVLFRAPVRDYNFVQIYRKSLLLELPSRAASTSFITPEKLIRAHRLGYRVVEVEVDYHRREHGEATAATLGNLSRALQEMTRLWWTLRRPTQGSADSDRRSDG